MHRRTPCVGICSTTYGDLVCRGCKRFAHEIVGWNGFADAQREAIWQRLQKLRDGAVATYVAVVDRGALQARAMQLVVPAREDVESTYEVAYQVLLRRRVPVTELAADGLRLQRGVQADTSRELIRYIDQEFYARSRAHYERNFRIATE